MTQPNQSDLDAHLAEQSWCADVPRPADAISVQPWADLDDEGKLSRMFTVNKAAMNHDGGTTKITVIGIQAEDGSCTRSILCEGIPSETTAAQARVIAAAILDAAGRAEPAA